MWSVRINRAVLTSPSRDWSEWPTMQTKDNIIFDKSKQQKLKVFNKCSSQKLLAKMFFRKTFSRKILTKNF
jgi:hypothetical protein